MKQYSTHSTLDDANEFIKQIKELSSFKVINHKIQESKRFGQGRIDYNLYIQFGGLREEK